MALHDLIVLRRNVDGVWLEHQLPSGPDKMLVTNEEGIPEMVDRLTDADGAFKIGADARLLPVAGGFKTQVRPDAESPWQEVSATIADPV